MTGTITATGASQTKALPSGTTTNGAIRWQLMAAAVAAAAVSVLQSQDVAAKSVSFAKVEDGTYEVTGQHIDSNGNLFGDVISSGEFMIQDGQIVSTFDGLTAINVTFTPDAPTLVDGADPAPLIAA